MSAAASTLKRTPLFDVHSTLKGPARRFRRLEHAHPILRHPAGASCRAHGSVGLFDVSHMGEIEIRGPEAAKQVDYVSTNNAGKMKTGQAHYSALLYEHGGFVDDILVHKVSDTHFFLCVNASNQEKDFDFIRAHMQFDSEVEFTSDEYAQLAIQGPKAAPTLQKLTDTNLAGIKYYWFADGIVSGVPARIAHTGYTGEDGFEIYIPPESAPRIWNEVLNAGEEFGIKPCGLGARNTLRLEAKMALYGHELTASTNPFEADLAWIVKMGKSDFVGRRALEKSLQQGVTRRLTGFEMKDRGIARDGYEIWIDGAPAAWVTSGGPSPTLNKNIGLCYLPIEKAVPGVRIQVIIRDTPVEAETVSTPFYKRAK